MHEYKQKILDNVCYTDLVYERINKKLKSMLSKEEIKKYIYETLKETDIKYFTRTGKNFYISNLQKNIRITINSNTYSVITVNKENSKQ